ncbi:bifunctional 3-demethylubiquinone-9 3-methyltransferase/ 2-octaprenyl-6-hydroxy phenol methylase [Chryseobacterium taklimakanense]|uniref:Bifunctional 3-demethylubiquinone-9 3-methyltransferase/ 2-octaprenyl-6-hydroxy phenol methylase n=1 Tax=Chryseobacterium taklimakanense TaxID=536441 RepID=A0A239XL03_9FLAO|nr:class I SAM-dependent methyltransferase [Chryseobacterium taklimakanense]SNV46906.1 bifunctional 3-demethylubiquinone-9 3-methyltransferase/ 2-octaprenyl-6-hydroxy phenol methylase [Chryseobacterium taklimakanense]
MKVKDLFLTQESFELQKTEIPGILRTSPVPSDLQKYYASKNYISHHQDSGRLKEKVYKFAQHFNLNYKRNILAKETFQNAKILDYGCGAGEFIKFIENDFSVLGYEPNHDARKAATNKVKKATLISDISEIEDGSLNAITMWHVFEHIDNQANMLHNFYKKLKNNGLLIIAVPNHTSFDARYYKEFWAAYDVPRHIYHFSKSGMEKLFNDENWKLKKIKPLLLDSYYISILSEKYKKNPLSWLKGGIVGAISNFKASKTGEFSSLIYIIEKKQKVDF